MVYPDSGGLFGLGIKIPDNNIEVSLKIEILRI